METYRVTLENTAGQLDSFEVAVDQETVADALIRHLERDWSEIDAGDVIRVAEVA